MLVNIYELLTKCEVKMAFFAWTETESRSINTQKKEKKNEANIQPS